MIAAFKNGNRLSVLHEQPATLQIGKEMLTKRR